MNENSLFNALIKMGTFLIICLVITFAGIRTVSAGTIKVVTRMGRVTGRVLEPGAHMIIPFMDGTTTLSTKKVIYETTTAEKQNGSDADYHDYPVDTNTSDGQQVDIFYTVRFSTDPTKATWVVQNIGSEENLVTKIVTTESRIWARNIPRQFEASSLYTGDVVEVQQKIEDRLRPVFEANGLILDSVGIREIKFNQEYINAIESKQIEAVKVETAENIAKQALFEKEATITRAEGAAKEQELQRATISEELLTKMWIEKWSGDLPQYMLGDAMSLINMPQ